MVGEGGRDDSVEKPGRKDKRAKTEASPGERARGEFRNRLNCCCRDGAFGTAMAVVAEMEAAGFALDAAQHTPAHPPLRRRAA